MQNEDGMTETASAEEKPTAQALLKKYREAKEEVDLEKRPNHPYRYLFMTEDGAPPVLNTDGSSRFFYLLDEGEVANLSPIVKKHINELSPEPSLLPKDAKITVHFYIASRRALLSARTKYDDSEQWRDLLHCAFFAGLTYLQANPYLGDVYLSYDVKEDHISDAPEISDDNLFGLSSLS
jgi:hypothetical protein